MKATVRKQEHSNISAGDYFYDEVCGLRQVVRVPNLNEDTYMAVDVERGCVGGQSDSIERLLNSYSGCRKVVPVGFENGKVVFE